MNERLQTPAVAGLKGMELRRLRMSTLHRAEEAEHQASTARHLAERYLLAVKSLEFQVEQARSRALEHESQGEPHEAAEQRHLGMKLCRLAEQNRRIAEEKLVHARICEQEVRDLKTLASRLDRHIRYANEEAALRLG